MTRHERRKRKIWNDAIKAAALEVMKLDGLIQDASERRIAAEYVMNLQYKRV